MMESKSSNSLVDSIMEPLTPRRRARRSKVSLSESGQASSSFNMIGMSFLGSSSDDDSDSSSLDMGQDLSSRVSLSGVASQLDIDPSELPLTIRDTKKAQRFRMLVVLLFVCLAVCVTLVIYFMTRNNEIDSFESAFSSLSAQLIDSVEFRLVQKIRAVDSLGISVTSYVMNSNNDSWPFVTIPDYELRGGNVVDVGDVLSVGMHPLVHFSERLTWGFHVEQNIGWLRDSESRCDLRSDSQLNYSTEILRIDTSSGFVVDATSGPYLPAWQLQPAADSMINVNILSHPSFSNAAAITIANEEAVISELEKLEKLGPVAGALYSDYYGCLTEQHLGDASKRADPMATMFYPIFDTFDQETRKLVGVFSTLIYFEGFFAATLPSGSGSIVGVVQNKCGDIFSYEIIGEKAIYLGAGDFHSASYESMVQTFEFSSAKSSVSSSFKFNSDYCSYSLRIYPQDDLHDRYVTNCPIIYSVSIALVILFVIFVALTYEYYLRMRLDKVMQAAKSSQAIVSSLFPARVRNHLLGEDLDGRRSSLDSKQSKQSRHGSMTSIEFTSRRVSNENSTIVQDIIHPLTSVVMAGFQFAAMAPAKMRLKFFLSEEETQNNTNRSIEEATYGMDQCSAPIADLFPHCTVMFADIEGFTAWSSEREPEQIFTLLQTIFQTFDRIARKRDIFKVETIGDCYVAVAGLPDPQPDHAIKMTKFARSCMKKVNEVTKQLELSLGPGTGNLRMRFGLHSGPVTAGVLRGEKSRFQLFGGTVNLAQHMEQSGKSNRIQISLATAHLLIEAGKGNWIVPRKNPVGGKDDSTMQSYWVLTRRQNTPSVDLDPVERPKFIPVTTLRDVDSDVESASGNGSVWGDDENWKEGNDTLEDADQIDRQIDWQVDLLLRLLNKIAAGRTKRTEGFCPHDVIKRNGTILEEISESIELPKFDPRAAQALASHSRVRLPNIVVDELRAFVRCIAEKYRGNPFHNFAHAIHVTMSANKLLSRIVKPECLNYHRESVFAIASDLHDHTYGITSDPLTHFAIMFSTLIHDVDHTGVSNQQRNEEEPDLAQKYKMRSVAEQNSVDVAWDLMLHDDFKNLRKFIFSTEAELKRFRQLVVNLVMATDIFEKEMKSSRDARWKKVFHSDLSESLEESEFRALKASIVIEHIIQAADVAHTMQHWKVYTKWNEHLFEEMYSAYKAGRSAKDPSEGWYKGELWFFDNYVIPLAKKLDECRVFGVASDECLNYALENRKEWARKGEAIVKEMTDRVKESQLNGEKPASTASATGPQIPSAKKLQRKESDPVLNMELSLDGNGMKTPDSEEDTYSV